MSPPHHKPDSQNRVNPFRRAVLSGLGILLPPLLTIVIFLWVGNSVVSYLLEPLEKLVRWGVMETADIRKSNAAEREIVDGRVLIDGEFFQQTGDRQLIPRYVYERVSEVVGSNNMPREAEAVYKRYIDVTWLQRRYVIPVFLCLLVLVLYLLGKFMAAGVGRFFWSRIELIIDQVPLVRNV